MAVLSRKMIAEMAQKTNVDIIANKVRTGDCILFLGAAVHYPPPEGSPFTYPVEERPPVGRELSELLAKGCGFTNHYPDEPIHNLQRVSLCYQIEKSREELVEEIRKAVHVGKQPSPVLCALARLPFSVIITTNYDQLFEKALIGARKNPRIGFYDKNKFAPPTIFRKTSEEEPFVFKLHGDIVQKTDSIVITEEDYIQFVLRMNDAGNLNPIPLKLTARIIESSTLFVGYSLLDYNLRLLYKTLRSQIDEAEIPQIYSVDISPDPLIFDVWQRREHVTFIAHDIWSFVPALYQEVMGEPMNPGICNEPPPKKKGP